MKKPSKRAAKPAQKTAKVAKKAPDAAPKLSDFKNEKSLVKALFSGYRPRGMKVRFAQSGGISFVTKDHAIHCDRSELLVQLLGAIGIKVQVFFEPTP